MMKKLFNLLYIFIDIAGIDYIIRKVMTLFPFDMTLMSEFTTTTTPFMVMHSDIYDDDHYC